MLDDEYFYKQPEEEVKKEERQNPMQRIQMIHRKKVSVPKRDISVDDIDPKQFTSQ